MPSPSASIPAAGAHHHAHIASCMARGAGPCAETGSNRLHASSASAAITPRYRLTMTGVDADRAIARPA
jgi:hypothetical protein